MVTNQALLFLIFIINGIIIGLIFDFFRILRKSFKTYDGITYLEDFLFWIITGFILLYSIFTFNNGEIRLYMFLAVIMGGIIYMILFSNIIIKTNVKIINILKSLVKMIFSILIFPFKQILKLVKKIDLFKNFKLHLKKLSITNFQQIFRKNSGKKKDFSDKSRNI